MSSQRMVGASTITSRIADGWTRFSALSKSRSSTDKSSSTSVGMISSSRLIRGMILRSITTCSAGELGWVYRDGANHLLPERWEELVSALPVDERDDLVAAFHARAERSPLADEIASMPAMRGRWQANTDALLGMGLSESDAAAVGAIQALADRYLDGRAPLFDQRIADGRANDGHGDLLADDVFCLEDGPRLLDCLEFDDRLRLGEDVDRWSGLARHEVGGSTRGGIRTHKPSRAIDFESIAYAVPPPGQVLPRS